MGERDGWQPIETVKKTSKAILVYVPSHWRYQPAPPTEDRSADAR